MEAEDESPRSDNIHKAESRRGKRKQVITTEEHTHTPLSRKNTQAYARIHTHLQISPPCLGNCLTKVFEYTVRCF